MRINAASSFFLHLPLTTVYVPCISWHITHCYAALFSYIHLIIIIMLPSEFLRTIWICEPPKGTLEVSHVESAMKLYLEHETKWISVDIQPKIEKVPYQIICKSPNNKLIGMRLKKDIFHLKWIGKNEPDFVRFCDKFNITEWRYFL